MVDLVPVDGDPFATPQKQTPGAQLVPVDADPFGGQGGHWVSVPGPRGPAGRRWISDAQQAEWDRRAAQGPGEKAIQFGKDVGQATDDTVRLLAEGMTLGGADKLAAALSGTDVADERARTQAARDRMTVMGPAAEATGNALLGSGLAKAGLSTIPYLKNAPMWLRALGLGGEGAAYGAANAAGHTDDGNYISNMEKGAEYGAATGAAIPVLGSVAAGAYRMAAPFVEQTLPNMGRRASGLITNALTPEGVSTLSDLGPEAMMVDANRGTTVLGQGTAARGGGDDLVAALQKRAAGTPARVTNDVASNLGIAADPLWTQEAIVNARKAETGPMFREAFDNAPAVDVSKTLDVIDRQLATAEGPEKTALQQTRKWLVEREAADAVPAARTPVTSADGKVIRYETTPGRPAQETIYQTGAENLHNVKGSLDNLIQYGDQGLGIAPGTLNREQGALKEVRRALNEDLRTQVPGYAKANDVSRGYAERVKALEYGLDAMKAGDNAIPPARFEEKFGGMPQDQQNLVRSGINFDVSRDVGNAKNKVAALENALQGGGDSWAPDKMRQAFGEEPIADLGATVRREKAFQNTTNRVTGGSNTGSTIEGVKQIEGDKTGILDAIKSPLKTAGELALGAASKRSSDEVRAQLAQALSAKGPELQRILTAIARQQPRREAIAQALMAASANPASSVIANRLLGRGQTQQQ